MNAAAVAAFGQGAVSLTARELNDSIARGAESMGSPEVPFDYFCECGDPACRDVLQLTIKQFGHRRPSALIDHPA
jgi:hypothetical protein